MMVGLILGDTPKKILRLPVDCLFRSLAKAQRENAIGIILFGTGSDGTLGVKAIKAAGGLVLAQSPETAQYDGMPCSAIATGQVDHIGPIEVMPEHLIAYVEHGFVRVPLGRQPIAQDQVSRGQFFGCVGSRRCGGIGRRRP